MNLFPEDRLRFLNLHKLYFEDFGYSFSSQDHEKAHKAYKDCRYKESLAILTKILENYLDKADVFRANIHNDIGAAYFKLGKFSESISHFKESFKIIEKFEPKDNILSLQLYTTISAVYAKIGKLPEAKEYQQLAQSKGITGTTNQALNLAVGRF